MGKTRSPNYPSISLATAMEKARVLYEQDHQNRMDPETVVRHLGYTSVNGANLGILSALRKFGLLEKQEGKKLRLTKDAVTILVDRPDSPERKAALERSALAPELFSQIHEVYPNPPSPENLKIHLQKQGFIANAAEQAAQSYLDTMQLLTPLSKEHNAAGKSKDIGGGMVQPQTRANQVSQEPRRESFSDDTPPGAGSLWLKVPFAGATLSVKIEADGQMLTKSHVARVIKYLELAKDDLEATGFLAKPSAKANEEGSAQ